VDRIINDNIDIAIKLLSDNITLSESKFKQLYNGPINPDVLIDKLLIFGLIKRYSETSDKEYTLTGLGHEVKRAGSWTKYLADKEEEKRLIEEQIRSSIRTNKTTIFILAMTVIISGLGAWVSYLNYDFVKTHQEPSGTSTDSLSNILLNREIEILQDLKEILKSDSSHIKIR